MVNDIPNFLPQSSLGTKLEGVDYDKVHSIDLNAISVIGAEWDRLIRKIGMSGGDALEIGSGTGALTLGLLQTTTFRSLVATDVSFKFLNSLKARSSPDVILSMAVCDANNLNFKDEAFDVVIGRSILHHLADYKLTLMSALRVLRPGGVAIFFEPVIQGKIIIALYAKLLLEADKMSGQRSFTELDRNRLVALARHLTKSKWYPQSRESLQKIEDKYIFDIEEMQSLGKAIGYCECAFHNGNEHMDRTYWEYFVSHLRILGIETSGLPKFKWIGLSFAETYGLVFCEKLVSPMGFFVFRK